MSQTVTVSPKLNEGTAQTAEKREKQGGSCSQLFFRKNSEPKNDKPANSGSFGCS